MQQHRQPGMDGPRLKGHRAPPVLPGLGRLQVPQALERQQGMGQDSPLGVEDLRLRRVLHRRHFGEQQPQQPGRLPQPHQPPRRRRKPPQELRPHHLRRDPRLSARGQAYHLRGLSYHRLPGVRFDLEPQLARQPQPPQNPRGVLLEPLPRIANRPDHVRAQVLLPSVGVEQVALQRQGHGVDGEVPPSQVLLQRHPDLGGHVLVRQPCPPVAAREGHVIALRRALGDELEHPKGPRLYRLHVPVPLQSRRHLPRHQPHHHKVQILGFPPHQRIPHRPPHQVHAPRRKAVEEGQARIGADSC